MDPMLRSSSKRSTGAKFHFLFGKAKRKASLLLSLHSWAPTKNAFWRICHCCYRTFYMPKQHLLQFSFWESSAVNVGAPTLQPGSRTPVTCWLLHSVRSLCPSWQFSFWAWSWVCHALHASACVYVGDQLKRLWALKLLSAKEQKKRMTLQEKKFSATVKTRTQWLMF